MTGLPSIVYSWRSIEALHMAVFTMNVAGPIIVVLAVIWATRLLRGFTEYLNLFAPGDGHLWPTMILLASLLCLPTYVLGIKAVLRVRSLTANSGNYPTLETEYKEAEEARQEEEEEDEEEDRRQFDIEGNRILYLHVLVCLISSCIVAGATVLSILRSSIFRGKLRDGLIEAIKLYEIDSKAKIRVDAIQMKFQCCGSNGYTDWFRVPWMKLSQGDLLSAEESGPQTEEQSALEDEEEDEDRDQKASASADVPFSCCSVEVSKPCVHHDILKASLAYGYEPERGLTISTKGCRSEILSYAYILGYAIVLFLTLLFVYQSVLCVLARFLQTAHRNVYYIGPRKSCYRVWILGGNPSKTDGHRSNDSLSFDTASLMPTRDVAEESKTQLLRKISSNFASMGTFRNWKDHGESPSADEPATPENDLSRTKADDMLEKEREEEKQENSEESETMEFVRMSSEAVAPAPPPLPQSPMNLKDDRQIFFKDKPSDKSTEVRPMCSFSWSRRNLRDRKEYTETRDYPLDRRECRCAKNRREIDHTDVRHNFFLSPSLKCWNASIYSEYNDAADSGDFGCKIDARRICETKSRVLSKFDPADAYDRFRGTLQDTLARREVKLLESTTKKARWTWGGKFVGESSFVRRNRIFRKFPSYRCTNNFPGINPGHSSSFPPLPVASTSPRPLPALQSSRIPVFPFTAATAMRFGNEPRHFSSRFRLSRAE